MGPSFHPNALPDTGRFNAITQVADGGQNDEEERHERWEAAKAALAGRAGAAEALGWGPQPSLELLQMLP